MPVPLQITVLNLDRSAALEARVRKMADGLEKFHSRIVSCRVNIEELRRHRSRGRLFHVRVDLRIPGKEIVSNHRHAKDPYLALRDSFLSLRRQLEDSTRVARGEVKKHPARTRRAAQGEPS
ncbi:MAG TPA: HPF/RaiA family ribosome-associated protein [Burkholderiales bacterium]|nr:HPF/RaiA family ribosome-associated protein [Burkholderiales bacterium]